MPQRWLGTFMPLPIVGRSIDRLLSRGEGLDASGDPFGRPLSPDEATQLLGAVRDARFASEGPLRGTISLPDNAAEIGVQFVPPDAASPHWAIVVHPYGAFARPGHMGWTSVHLSALRRAGFAAAAPEMPHHGGRARSGKTSGWGFVRADLAHTSRAIAAAGAEVTALCHWLRQTRGAETVVGVGLSLGGAALGLAAAMGAPFDGLAFVAAVDNPASFYMTGENRAARRRTLAAAGYHAVEIEHAFRPVAPSTRAAPACPRLWVIPEHDLVVPAHTQHAWADKWHGEVMSLKREGHGTGLVNPLVARRVARWYASQI